MDKANYTDLLEALTYSSCVVIVAVIKGGELIDWVPAAEYCTLQDARNDNEWPEDAELRLLYGLDAITQFGCDGQKA